MILRSTFLLFMILGWQVLLSQVDSYVDVISEEEKTSISTYLQNRYWSATESKVVYEKQLSKKQKESSAVVLQKEILKEYFRNSRNFLRNVNAEHTVIKILNKQGLEENLIFLFEQFDSDHAISLSGLKIIKPNGVEQVIDIDKWAVFIKSGKFTKKRLVIPNLEVGDIIDYYSYLEFRVLFLEQYSRTYNPIYIIPQNSYPVLEYNLVFSLGPSAFINVSNHKLPTFEKTSFKVNKRTFTRFSLQLKNLERYPKDLKYFFPFRALPNLKFQVFIGPYYGNTDVKYSLGGTLKMNTSIQMSKLQDFMFEIVDGRNKIKFYKELKNDLKERNINVKNIDNQLLLDELYSFYRNQLGSNVSYDKSGYHFVRALHRVFDKLKIEHDIVIAFNREVSNIDKFMLTDEIELLLKVKFDSPNYIVAPNRFTIINELPHRLEGTEVYLYNPSTRSLKKETLPASTVYDNTTTSEYDVHFTDSIRVVSVTRQVQVSGNEKSYYQTKLTADDSFNARISNSHKNLLTEDIKNQIGEIEDESYSLDVQSLGDCFDKKELRFTDRFKLKEFVNTSNENVLIPIGKLLPSEHKIQKERNFDVYFDSPYSQCNTIIFYVPEGFRLGSTNNFDFSVVNSVGEFSSVARISDNKLIIEVKKRINHYTESKDNWSQIVEVLEAVTKFNHQNVLLRAK